MKRGESAKSSQLPEFASLLKNLPHRPPFVFVREILKCEPGKSSECATTFEANDPMFTGHFPGNPLVPGVILTEALAQAAGIAGASGAKEGEAAPKFLLSAIRQMKFAGPIRPNERIILRAEKTGQMGDLWQFAVSASVDSREVASGQIVLNAV